MHKHHHITIFYVEITSCFMEIATLSMAPKKRKSYINITLQQLVKKYFIKKFTFMICLDTVYFADTEKLLIKVL